MNPGIIFSSTICNELLNPMISASCGIYKQSHLPVHVDWCHSYITNVHSQSYIHHREETCSSPSCARFYMAIIQGIKEDSHGLQYSPK